MEGPGDTLFYPSNPPFHITSVFPSSTASLRDSAAKQHSEGFMSLKHQLFALEYVKDFNGTRAATAAGYPAKTASGAACRLIKKPEVRESVAVALAARCERIQIDTDWVLAELVKNYYMIMQGVHFIDGTGKPTGAVRVDRGAAIKILEVIGKHVDVGAFREPAVAHTSDDLVERLQRGRERVNALRKIEESA